MAIAPDGQVLPGPDRLFLVTSRLRDRRHVLGLTQKQVVTRLAALGVASTNKSLSSLEHGSGIDVGKLPELAAALDCTVTYLLGLTEDPARWQPDAAVAWGSRPTRARPAAAPTSGSPGSHRGPETASSSEASRARVEEEQCGWILGPYVPDRSHR